MGGRGSKSSRAAGGGGEATPEGTLAPGSKAPEGSGAENGVVHAKASVPDPPAGSPDFAQWGPTDQPSMPAGFALDKRGPNVGNYRFRLRGPDGGSVGVESKAQATRVASHLSKYKLPTNLRNVPGAVLFK